MEAYFQVAFGSTLGIVLYVLLYVSAIAVSTVWDLFKYKDDWNYCAVYGFLFPLVCRPYIFQHFLERL